MNMSTEHAARLARFAVDHAMDAVLWANPEGQILYANDAALRTLGTSGAATGQRSMFEIAPELNQDLWRELWKEIRQRGTFSFEFSLKNEQGQLVQVEMTVNFYQLDQQDLACVFFRGTEEKKQLEIMRQEFVGTVSHELRTPLTVIREGVSQVVEGLRGDINELQKRALDMALTGIDRLGRIIDDLLDLSKMESGKTVLRRERLDLCALVREVMAGFQTIADDRGIELRVTTPAGALMIFADHDRLIQVFTNLLNNAFKFTEKGRIELSLAAQADRVECAVLDSGVGMLAEEIPRIFNKFEQLSRASVTGERGTGLGLSISKAIVELHKGRIRAESDGHLKGSRFVFELPRLDARDVFREQVAASLKEVALRGGNLTTLLMDVENVSRDAVDPARVEAVLEGLEDLVRKNTGRKTDFVIKGARTVYVGLPSTIKREASRVAERILRTFETNVQKQGLAGRLRMRTVLTGYPEDASEEMQFLDKAIPEEKAA